MQCIRLQIFQVSILIESDCSEVLELLKKDFWSYIDESQSSSGKTLKLELHNSLNRPSFPSTVASMQTQNAISYDVGSVRYCDYYGALYSVIDFATNKASIYSLDLDKIREIAYLLILSIVGKIMDVMGLHKLHAFSVSFEKYALVCMMPSKGGKSTLLTELLKDNRIKMISDDIPIIDSSGMVHPFLLKIGLDTIPEEFNVMEPAQNIYSMKRAQYGTKQLICTRGIPNKIENAQSVFSKVILMESFRYNGSTSQIAEGSWAKLFKGLFKHGIMGVGSPIIIEYFWQSGFKDFLLKTYIFFRRLSAFFLFSIKAERYVLLSGTDTRLTANLILSFLEKKQMRD